MAIASSAVESPSTMSRKTNCLEKPTEQEVKMDVDDPHLGNPGSASASGDSKQPQQINPGPPIASDQGSGAKSGKTCHQCRQKITDLAVECKFIKKNKQCVIKLCPRCLLNRYGEKVEDVVLVDGWKCPKCRGICNCSNCMRKRGQKPTGPLTYKAKASGFSSVSEMIIAKGTEILTKHISPKKLPASDEDCVVASPLKHQKENNSDQTCEASSEPMEMDDAEKDEEPKEVEIILPHGTEMTNVANVDFPVQDVGDALQFNEFCSTFGEVLDIKKGQVESILNDIMAGRSRPGKTTSLIQFQIQLLMLIKDLGEESPLSTIDGKNCWLHVLKDCISESEWVPKELAALDFGTNEGYCTLGSSEKLRLLIFLCDETLETMPLRTWIEEQNLKFCEEKKQARGKLLAAKEKEKFLKKQLHDEVVKATTAENGASLSIAEHEPVVSELKAEIERAHAEILEATALLPKYERKSNALRTEPVFIDAKGRAFWRLKGCDKSDLLLQDMSSVDEEMLNEKWFSFDDVETRVINEHISLHCRVKRQRRRKAWAPAQAPVPAAATNLENGNMNPEIDLNEIPDRNPWKENEGSGETNGKL